MSRHSAIALWLAAAVWAADASSAQVYLTYQIAATGFVDSNNLPPPAPTSTSVSGTIAFAIDDAIGSGLEQNNIAPLWVSGFDIVDNQGNTFDHNETNSAVDAYRFTQASINDGQVMYGGTFNTNDFIAGGSNDFRVRFRFNLTTYQPNSISEHFTFVSSAFDSVAATSTTVTLVGVSNSPPSPIPLPAAAYLFASAAMLLAVRVNQSSA